MHIKFPILGLVDNDNFLYFFDKEERLKKTSEDIFKKGVLPGEKYIDSNGFIFKVINIKKIGYAPFFGFSLVLKGRQIKIEMEFDPNVEKMELSTLKQIALEKVEKTKQFWKEAWSIKDLKNAIKNAQSFEELIILFK
ncbi:hypothetical protein [Flavobacterium lipolyticum]|uniref:Uncharacterized protein n=1 Tax=Flavobacterium lipolyticum TaxID=2893754 RepID=A0ABS8M4K5_9FLAO|nr:hypothetical protein [Flavobacterium sp. F-126]MCC9019749.1 hypothetical protein [Flavobacterium sp. F-126]